MGHKHAALMALYAQDAAETETPWERWQYRVLHSTDKEWSNPTGGLVFYNYCEYRRKPQMVTRTITYPEPCREALEKGEKYWIFGFDNESMNEWNGDALDKCWLAQGRIHLTREAAEAHRLALLGGGDE